MNDPYDLERFLAAQSGSYQTALREIRRGSKRSHWMWYIFPQIAGLGPSAMARHYAITSIDEARAYLAHPMLGARLRECVAALRELADTSADGVFGSVDAMKLRSSLTLFAEAGGGPPFAEAIDRWFAGQSDDRTTRFLGGTRSANGGALAVRPRTAADDSMAGIRRMAAWRPQ
jgi:uncharacterized protein (DUF1810 family)